MVEVPSFAVTVTGAVEAGCGGSETRHAPLLAASAEACATTACSGCCAEPADLPTATVTLAPGAAQPQTEAACGACCSTMPGRDAGAVV